MTETRPQDWDGLMSRLEELLGQDSLLFWLLRKALRTENEAEIAAATASLRLYSSEVQIEVEDEVLRWLLDPSELWLHGEVAKAD